MVLALEEDESVFLFPGPSFFVSFRLEEVPWLTGLLPVVLDEAGVAFVLPRFSEELAIVTSEEPL